MTARLLPKSESAVAQEGTLRRRRLPRAERRAAMLDAAVDFFAERGFSAPTRDLAHHLGVTQALIYKHFGSKETFIGALLDRAFADRPKRDSSVLDDAGSRLAERLAAFYASAGGQGRIRLFVRAGLDGWPLPARHGARLTREVFQPVIAVLRREAGLDDFTQRRLMRGERELAMMLHGAIVFLGIREHVYRMPMPGDRAALVRFYVEIYLPGALRALRRIHEGKAGEALALAQLMPARR